VGPKHFFDTRTKRIDWMGAHAAQVDEARARRKARTAMILSLIFRLFPLRDSYPDYDSY
jgi:hypothetical protein